MAVSRIPWFLTATATATTGLVIAYATHKNVPDTIDTLAKPGKVVVEYRQAAPGLGKVLSFFCASATAVSLWIAFRDDRTEELSSVFRSKKERRSVLSEVEAMADSAYEYESRRGYSDSEHDRASFGEHDRASFYDAEPEIDVNEDKQTAKQTATTQTEDAFFKTLFFHTRRHLLIPCATGSGKTTLLLGAIKWAVNYFGQNGIEFFVSTTKKGSFLGLEKLKASDGRSHVLFVDPENPETILPLYERLRWLRKRLIARGEQRMALEEEGREYRPKPVIVVLDEWNECLDVAKRYDRKSEQKSCLFDELREVLNSVVRTGREDGIVAWVLAQDHQVQNCGINTGYTKNLGLLVPFRKDGDTGSIEDVFVGQRPLVRGNGREMLAKALKLANDNPQKTFAYSNLCGHAFLEVPYLPDIKRQRIFAVAEQSNVVAFRPKTEPQVSLINGANNTGFSTARSEVAETIEDPWLN